MWLGNSINWERSLTFSPFVKMFSTISQANTRSNLLSAYAFNIDKSRLLQRAWELHFCKKYWQRKCFPGIGGSGRQSAAKLSAFMADYDLFQIEITRSYTPTEWREDIKKVRSILNYAFLVSASIDFFALCCEVGCSTSYIEKGHRQSEHPGF